MKTKTKLFQLLTLLLTTVMLFVLSLNVMAAKSNAVTKDGLTAQLFTDKDSYKTGESVTATVQVDNHTGNEVFIFVQMNTPEGVKLASENNAFDTCLQDGETWTTAGGASLSAADIAAGITATGDNMHADLWVVLTVLAVCGIITLFVYGKNNKTWLSVLLCMAMVVGMAVAAVPAQAADMNGEIQLSCSIQVDGKAAELSATVGYVIYDEAEETEETVETEVPLATEAPAEMETPGATEAPAEMETPGATETPEPEVPDAGKPETDDIVTASQNGYYVVCDDFNYGAINTWTETCFSSWDVAMPVSSAEKVSDGACFPDGSVYAKGEAVRAFNAVSTEFTLEFSMRIVGDNLKDTFLDIRNGDTTAIRFAAKGDKLYLGEEELCELTQTTLTNFKLYINPIEGTYTISVDGETVREGENAKRFTFLNDCTSVDRIYIETGKEDIARVIIGTLRIYVDYYVNEKFLDGVNGTVNDEWTVTGNVATVYRTGTYGPDKYSALLKDGGKLQRTVAYEQDGAWVEYQMLAEDNDAVLTMYLSDEAGNEFKLENNNGAFGYYDASGNFVKLYDCVKNLWYHVILKQTDEGTKIYLNHKLKKEGIVLPFEKFTSISFVLESGEAYLDDIIVKDWVPLPDDYVPEPIEVEKEEGSTLVGLQSCNLWVEGEHFGYDWITDWEERTPILGYYDENVTEAADWELKYKVEHGIDFELFCWYRPNDGFNQPIKQTSKSRALFEGYMNAEYSDMMKFAITWETGGGVADLDDFKKNVIPYWIEQFFKDDRYLLIDNKPLLGMYNITLLKQYFGDINGVKAALDAVREACIEAGFDGVYIIMSNSSASLAAEVAQAGFDGQYAYTWGSTSNIISTQTKGMQSMQNTLVNAGQGANGVVPTVSMGFWDKAWDRDNGAYCSPENFQAVLQWVRDEFSATLDQNSVGAKMVLLDNWNEYAEGHYIMPTRTDDGGNFAYLDAVRAVYGDGDGADGEHTALDIAPTEAQLARINHMYVQDRHVVLVDKDVDNSDLEVIEGYDWQFNTNGDAEGWTVGEDAGIWIKALKNWSVKDGAWYGETYTPSELAEKYPELVAQSKTPTADPSVMSPDNLNLNASDAVAIKVKFKGVSGTDAIGKPEIYFITEADQTYSGGKRVQALYGEEGDNYVEITFDMTGISTWTGIIKQLRFDPIERDGEFWIDSIQVLKRKDSGDAEIYLDGERLYTSSPVIQQGNSYMYPVEELNKFGEWSVRESLNQDRLYIGVNDVFMELPYEGSDKLLVNGTVVESVGACTIGGALYVPIQDIFENLGRVQDCKGDWYPAYSVEVTQATATDKAKINISSFVDSAVLKGYYFNTSIEGWTYAKVSITPSTDGMGRLTVTATEATAKLWSPENPYFNVDMTKADHVRMRVKTDATNMTNLTITLFCDHSDTANRSEYTYNIPLTEDLRQTDGFYDVRLNLEDVGAFANAQTLDRARIMWYTEGAGATQTLTLDSFEILDIVDNGAEDDDDNEGTGNTEEEVLPEMSSYTIYDWCFERTVQGWTQAGATGVSQESGSLKLVTALKSNGVDHIMKAWSSNTNVDQTIINPINIRASEATHVLVRVKSEKELTSMKLDITYYNAETGKDDGSVSYNNIPYQKDSSGNYIVKIELNSNTAYDTTKVLSRLCICPVGDPAAADVGDYVLIDSIEILNQNCTIADKSAYFTDSVEGWGPAGTTTVTAENGAMKLYRKGAEPKCWSSETALYGYTKDEVTHVRIRIKAEVPEDLSSLTDDQKTKLAEITTAELLLKAQFSDGNTKDVGKLSYELGREGFVMLTYDLSGIWPDGTTLSRLNLHAFAGNTEKSVLWEAGTSVYIDSVQLLKEKVETTE